MKEAKQKEEYILDDSVCIKFYKMQTNSDGKQISVCVERGEDKEGWKGGIEKKRWVCSLP